MCVVLCVYKAECVCLYENDVCVVGVVCVRHVLCMRVCAVCSVCARRLCLRVCVVSV